MNPTYWVKMGKEGVHMACLTEDEVMLTLMFCQPDSPGSEKPCVRCNIPLSEVPDP